MKKVEIGIIIVIIIIVVGFLPIVGVPYTETVQYLDTETYEDIVPVLYQATHLEEVPAGPNDLETGYDRHGNLFTFEEKTSTEYYYKAVERERVVIKERLETHYKKVPIFEYLLSRF